MLLMLVSVHTLLRRRQRMLRQGSSEGEVASMQRLLCDYEAKCLAGEASTPEETKQVGC